MRSNYTTLMQSKYFNPAFNSAIFDGPLRIYFAQFHEALALKVYFMVQQKLADEVAKAKEVSKASGANILVMIYPTVDAFEMAFENSQKNTNILQIEKWREDVVIGTRGPIEDESLDLLIDTLRQTMNNWRPAPIEATSALAEL